MKCLTHFDPQKHLEDQPVLTLEETWTLETALARVKSVRSLVDMCLDFDLDGVPRGIRHSSRALGWKLCYKNKATPLAALSHLHIRQIAPFSVGHSKSSGSATHKS